MYHLQMSHYEDLDHWAYLPIHFIHLHLLSNLASPQTFGGVLGGARTGLESVAIGRDRARSDAIGRPTSEPLPLPTLSPRSPNPCQGNGFFQDSPKTSPKPSKDHSNTPHGPPDTRPKPPRPVHEPLKTRPRAPKTLAVLMVSPDLEDLIFRN